VGVPAKAVSGEEPARRFVEKRRIPSGSSGRPEEVGHILFHVSRDILEEARKMSPAERLQLISRLWDTLSEEDVPVSPEERALLDARAADLQANPQDQSPWSEVKARLELRRR